MKRFYLISLLLLLPAMAMPCFDIGYGNKYWTYFNMKEFGEPFTPDFLKFWQGYAGADVSEGDVEELSSPAPIDPNTSQNPIYVAARKKNDAEMLEYLRLNNLYRQRRKGDYDLCSNLYREVAEQDEYFNEEYVSWYYPTKADLDNEKANIAEVISKAKSYTGTKYADRYILLAMRGMFQTAQFDELCSYYSQNISRVPATSDCLYSIDDLYAGALLRTGRADDAMEIYAKICDNTSLSWCIAGKADYKTLMQVYDKNHNSRTIPWIMVQYIDRIQYNLTRSTYYSKEDSLHNLAIKREAKNFIDKANQIADSKETDSPALWKSAAAYCNYLSGNLALARRQIDAAMSMDGNTSVKENARMTRLIIYCSEPKITSQDADLILKDLKWLKFKVKGDVVSYIQNLEAVADAVKDKALSAAVAGLYSTACEEDTENYAIDNGLGWAISIDNGGTANYTSKYFGALTTLTAAETEDFYNNFGTKNELSKWLWPQIKHDADYFNDLIGTKYLAEGNYTAATKFLEKVPLKFLDTQGIAKYMVSRSYTTERWITKQNGGNDYNNWLVDEEHDVPPLTKNPKLDFCKEMQSLAFAAKNDPQKAYQFATRLFQASHFGDCWYLAKYFRSSSTSDDGVTPDRQDFASKAAEYLDIAAESNDPAIKEKALFAAAYIGQCIDEMDNYVYNSEARKYENHIKRNSLQFQSLNTLADFERGRAPSKFVTDCELYDYFVDQFK